MKKILYIGFGGFFGAILRVSIIDINLFKSPLNLNLNLLFTNMLGCFILSFILSFIIDENLISNNMKLAISTGFCGALTTFSSFCKESIGIIMDDSFKIGIIYIIATIFLGLFTIFMGEFFAKKLTERLKFQSDKL